MSGLDLVTEGNLSDLRLLTVSEVADRVRLSRMTVYRLIHAGELPALKLGGSYRISQTALTRLIQGSSSHGSLRPDQVATAR